MTQTTTNDNRVSIGIPQLDEACNGGLPANAAYLIRGGPGSGKTTLCLHFLVEGVQRGENTLFVSFGEREARIRENAPPLLDLSSIQFLDLSPPASAFTAEASYDIFASADVEGQPVIESVRNAVEQLQPKRVVIDSMTHLRYLSSDAYQYRKHTLGLIHFLMDNAITVLFTSESAAPEDDEELAFMSDGVIELTAYQHARRLSIPKLRGSTMSPGPHTYTIGTDGISVSPRLQSSEHTRKYSPELISSGVAALDDLSNGGFHRGSVTVISGPSGVGKSNIGMLYMKEAAARGERSVVISFEEAREMIIERCRSVNIPVDGMLDGDMLAIYSIEPLSHSPDELAAKIRYEVEQRNAKILMLDSLASFRLSIKTDDQLIQRLHEICRYLGNMGVSAFLIDETENLTGQARATDEGFSYLTDNILLLRYINHDGGLGRVIGMLKKRTGDFNRYPLRFSITSSGIRIHESFQSLDSLIPGLSSTDTLNAATAARGTPSQSADGY